MQERMRRTDLFMSGQGLCLRSTSFPHPNPYLPPNASAAYT